MRSVGEILRSDIDELLRLFRDWNASLLRAPQLDGKIKGKGESALPAGLAADPWDDEGNLVAGRGWAAEEREYRAQVAAAKTTVDLWAIREKLRDDKKALGQRGVWDDHQKKWRWPEWVEGKGFVLRGEAGEPDRSVWSASGLTETQKRYWLLHSGEYKYKSASEAAAELELQVRTVIDWRREHEHAKRPAVRKATPAPRDCEGCGETFTPKRSHARTCSDRCRKRLQRPTKVAA